MTYLKTEQQIRDMKESGKWLKDILQQQIPSEPLPSETETTSTKPSKTEETSLLSPYQQQLLSRRNQHQIGDAAWAALGGNNTKLAQALATAIGGYPGRSVDMFCRNKNNFKISVNDKTQSYLYKF